MSDTPATAELNDRQLRFLGEYVAGDLNGTLAYLQVFPDHSYSTARFESSKLLANPNIQAALAAVREELARTLRISALKVMREIAAIAFADIGEAFEPDPDGGMDRPRPLSRMSPLTREAIKSAKVKRRIVKGKASEDVLEEVEEVEYQFHSKLDALDKLCKRLGLFEEDEKKDETLTEPEKIALLVKILQTDQEQPEPPTVAPAPLNVA